MPNIDQIGQRVMVLATPIMHYFSEALSVNAIIKFTSFKVFRQHWLIVYKISFGL